MEHAHRLTAHKKGGLGRIHKSRLNPWGTSATSLASSASPNLHRYIQFASFPPLTPTPFTFGNILTLSQSLATSLPLPNISLPIADAMLGLPLVLKPVTMLQWCRTRRTGRACGLSNHLASGNTGRCNAGNSAVTKNSSLETNNE